MSIIRYTNDILKLGQQFHFSNQLYSDILCSAMIHHQSGQRDAELWYRRLKQQHFMHISAPKRFLVLTHEASQVGTGLLWTLLLRSTPTMHSLVKQVKVSPEEFKDSVY